MERRFEIRKHAILHDAQIKPQVAEGMLKRLEQFARPFVVSFARHDSQANVRMYLGGLLSDLGRKNVESIAYRYDRDRGGLQYFIGVSPWSHCPLQQELSRQVGTELGEADGVIGFDPSGFPKCGTESVGVQRQWLGRLGKVDNGQVGVYMSYASRKEYALVDQRLYLPRCWATDKRRRKKCGVPKTIGYQARHALALEMLKTNGPLLPHAWITGDDEMGRSSGFRKDLRALGERYLLAVPSNTGIRDRESPPPAYSGRGQPPKQPFQRVDRWRTALDRQVWTRVDVRDGEKGPLVTEMMKRRVIARTERGKEGGAEELLVVTRTLEFNGTMKYDSYLSNAPAETSLEELARVVKAGHRIEDGFKRAKSEAGLADYEVRTWAGWQHHQTLSLIALWFLILETRRGKKIHPGIDGSPGSEPLGYRPAAGLQPDRSRLGTANHRTKKQTTRVGSILSLQAT
ncbi:MAG: IS701 family transposase [Candidatus Aminicenantes bacterium]|nr:IS701 family transposase [Candidatus Aminicenantes bacterium]